MKYKIILKQKNNEFIELSNIHHFLQSAILGIQPMDISKRLHEGGIRSVINPKRVFKEISFSGLIGTDFEIKNKRIRFKGEVTLYVSSPNKELLSEVVNNIYLRTLYVGRGEFNVNDIQIFDIGQECEELESMDVLVSTLSPIVLRDVYKNSNNRSESVFYFPEDEEFNDKLIGNLKNKFSATYQTDDLSDFKFEIEPIFTKVKVTNYKNSLYAGTVGNFRVISNYKTLKVVNGLGLGGKNAQGFGQVMI